MTAVPRQLRPKAAKGPVARTVTVVLDGEFEGWEATARADFKARYFADMQSESLERIIGVLDRIILTHNFPDAETGELAESIGDVDNAGLQAVAGAIFDAIGKLPNR